MPPINKYSPTEYTPDSLAGFETIFYPQWAIEFLYEIPLGTPEWFDAHNRYYKEYEDLAGEVGGFNFRPLKNHPEDLKIKLDQLRKAFPDIKFRMVVRVQAQKDLGV